MDVERAHVVTDGSLVRIFLHMLAELMKWNLQVLDAALGLGHVFGCFLFYYY